MTPFARAASFGLLLLLCALCRSLSAQDYHVVGMGGGGAMYEPASSPHNPKLMFVSCDMSGFYRSDDGGKSWQMVDFRQMQGNTRGCPVFHPRNRNVIFFSGMISDDQGKTWRPIANAPWRGGITRMAVGPEGRIVLAGTSNGTYISTDEGKTWSKCEGVTGSVVGMLADRTVQPGPRLPMHVFIATPDAVYRSDDEGKSWTDKSGGLPWKGIRGFAGAFEPRGTPILYCTIPSKNENGKFAGGVYRSTDLGDTWESAMGDGINTRLGKVDQWGSGDIAQYARLAVPDRIPKRAYVTCTGTGYWPPNQDTVYRTDDGGMTWRPVMFYDFRFKKAVTPDYAGAAEMNFVQGWIQYAISYGWGGMPARNGLHVNPRNPDVLMAANGGELFATTDGGKLWQQIYTAYAPGQEAPVPEPGVRPGRWQSIGLEVTTTWNYRIDPHDHNRHFICYTDIGCIRSEDGGRTWTDSNKGTPWSNTTYDMAFDPARKGVVWAAMANVHDIPHWTYIHDQAKGPGGVCVSTDGGVTWKVSSEGLPSAPTTCIVLDPTSPAANRTLYTTLYDYGVYKSTDDGKSWKAMNNGIDLKTNSHTWVLKRMADGTLYCGVTAKRGPGSGGNKFEVPGAVYKSTDGGEHWTNILESCRLVYPGEFAVNPKDQNVIYLTAHTAPAHEEGGMYVTTDGGKSWTRHLTNADFVGKGGPNWATPLFVTLDPKDPETIYMGADGHGLWTSRDRAKTWKQLEGVPFANIHRVEFDPDDANKVYITTFGGGVWVGPKP